MSSYNKPTFLVPHDCEIQVENTEQDANMEEVYPIAYAPIPKAFIKEELEEPPYRKDRERCVRQNEHLMAYPALPHGGIKEESYVEDDDDKSHFGFQVN